jgi:putative N-acetylmannosamine-6-phosphate epimerase
MCGLLMKAAWVGPIVRRKRGRRDAGDFADDCKGKGKCILMEDESSMKDRRLDFKAGIGRVGTRLRTRGLGKANHG